MNKAKLIRNSILSIIAFILIILGSGNISNATDYGKNYHVSIDSLKKGDTFSLSMNEYDNLDTLFCVEHKQKLTHYKYYNYYVSSIGTIEGTSINGDNVTGKDAKLNARLAAAIHYTGGDLRQRAIWYYLYEWVDQVGEDHGFDKDDVNNNNTGFPAELRKKVNKYANRVVNGVNSTDAYIERKETDIVTKLPSNEEYRDKYVQWGPINLEFDPELAKLEVKGYKTGTTKEIEIEGYKFIQSGEVFSDVSKIKSGKEFSILIPIDQQISQITNIYAKTKKPAPTEGIITAKIAILSIVPGQHAETYQNLALVESSATQQEQEPADLTWKPGPDEGDTTADIKIVKVDEEKNEIKLANVGFKLKHKQLNKWVKKDAQGNTTYVSEENATTFLTGEDGTIHVEKLLLGDYEFKEVIQPYYGYECTTTEFTIENNKKVKKYIIKNKQKYIKLTGYVWLDNISGKLSVRNDLFRDNDADSEDTLVPGVTVRLKDLSGNIVTNKDGKPCTALTDENGSYIFEGILVENLGNYYMEFEYNGLTYTNVIPHIDRDNGSKAAETEAARTELNQKFSVIEQGVAKDSSGNVSYNLSYNISNHIAELTDRDKMDSYVIDADTNQTGYSIKDQYETRTSAIDGVENINLGLYEREQPDLALIKDIQNVRLTINGYEHTYEYAQRFKNQGKYGDGFNVGVKFGNEYGKMKYTRAIYKSDYTWKNPNESRELQAYITYKIQIKNESTGLITKVNNIVDYYDANYTLVGVGTQLDEKGNINSNNQLQYSESDYNEDYRKITVNTDSRIEAQNAQDIYVQFKLNRGKVVELLNGGESLDNVVEINSYSTFDEQGNVYAGVDKDSAPGNAIPGNEDTYEDDTDKAPALQLEVADNARIIKGTVFLDQTEDGLKSVQIREGDGKYIDGEKTIDGVKIKLVEKSGTELEYYIGEGNTVDFANSVTSGGGNFSIQGFIPGDYKLVYTWGEQNGGYDVQNYKGTVYKQDRYKEGNGKWYRGDGVQNNNVDTRYTDAIDDYAKRQEIDEELKIKTNSSDSTKITPNRSMDSITPKMKIGVEYEDAYTASSGDQYTYEIKNIDFGIVRRPIQSIQLTKRVSAMKVTLANDQVISDVTIDESGNITGEKSHLTYMGPANGNSGFIKAELDNELIQGAKLEVTYEFKFENQSEVDVINPNYYTFGSEAMSKSDNTNFELKAGNETKGWANKSEVVWTQANKLIDYLDRNWGYEENKNTNWKAMTKEELEEKYKGTLVNADIFGETSSINNRIILYTEELYNQQCCPGENSKVNLQVSKALSTADEISLENETEIIEVEKDGGSKIVQIPGSFVPGTTPQEPDEDWAETVIVTPSTGKNLNFILPISIGISALVILGTGIIVIKKKVI